MTLLIAWMMVAGLRLHWTLYVLSFVVWIVSLAIKTVCLFGGLNDNEKKLREAIQRMSARR